MSTKSSSFERTAGARPAPSSAAGIARAAAAEASSVRAGAEPREFEFTAADFERVRALIHKRAGISLRAGKEDMVYSRLARRLRATGAKSFAEYLGRLERGDPTEWEAFTNSLTTNLTAFFREEHHFPILAEHIRQRRSRGNIVLWCSASSTGEEPYSIAITMADVFGSLRPPVRILATDLDTQVLKKAEAGVYSMDKVDRLPPEVVRRYFLKGTGVHAGHAMVRPELREMITFRQVNLLDGNWPIRGPLEAIFCRNVMIYFDKPTQYRILQKFVPLLQPDGLLFAGHSESFFHAADLFRPRGRTVYELSLGARAGAGVNARG